LSETGVSSSTQLSHSINKYLLNQILYARHFSMH
jgi:hypothetical protein